MYCVRLSRLWAKDDSAVNGNLEQEGEKKNQPVKLDLNC